MIGCDLDAIQNGEDRKLFNEAMKPTSASRSPRAATPTRVEDAETHRRRARASRVVLRPIVHAGRRGRRHRATTSTSCARIVSPGPRALAGRRGARRGVHRWAGRNTRWRSCAMRPATASSCAPSRTSTPWACTRATPSPSPRRRRLPTWSTSACATRRSPSSKKIGVETGGSNVQFAVNPENGRMIVIEMNPRVIALLGARVQGDGLSHREGGGQARRWATRCDEIVNDITKRHARLLRAFYRLRAWSRSRASPSRSSKAPTTRCPRA